MQSASQVRKQNDGAAAHGFQPEIQGMRALSVLAVIWAHAGFAGLPGGFTGVDVFFVISGFLITRLLLAEMERTGRIDLLAFWARRARRLLPNAFTALIGTVLLALFLFPGYNPGKLATEITYAALNFVNFHFADQAVDYFQSEGAASPILHFWSLSVEEQFYMLWPPVLLGLGLYFRQDRMRAVILMLAMVWCVSFAASLYITYEEQPFAYFGTGTRCWQLATGALIAAGWNRVERLPSRLRGALAWLGLASILLGMAVLGEKADYPGLWALLPTLGAAALIAGFGAASPYSLLRRGLSAPLMQWIGERSYSWYLWHWPLLALPRITYADNPYIELIAVPASLVLACAAYSWIETPIRKGQFLAARPLPTLAGAVAGLAVVIAGGYLYVPAISLKDAEMANRVLFVEAVSKDYPATYADKCHLSPKRTEQRDCLYGDVTSSRQVALLGDSHAAHWFEGLRAASEQAGWALRSWTRNACIWADVPIMITRGEKPYTACWDWREKTMAALTGPDRPDLVVLSSYMNIYKKRVYDPSSGKRLGADEGSEALRAGMRKTIERLLAAGVNIALIRDVPQAFPDYQSCYIVNNRNCARPRDQAIQERSVEDMIAREFAGRIKIFDFTDAICTGAECPIVSNGVMVYRDPHHLTARFSASLAPQMVNLLQAFPEKPKPTKAVPHSAREHPLSSALGGMEATVAK